MLIVRPEPKHRRLLLRLDNDPEVDSPCDWDCTWKLYSFSRRHRSFKHPEELGLGARDQYGEPKILNPGLRRKLDVGLAFLLSYYEHGNCVWSLKGGGPRCQFDTVGLAGLLVWNAKPKDLGAKTYEERRKDAASFLEVYTDWCNGNCYCYSLEDVHGKLLDSCGGFIGSDDDSGLSDAIRAALRVGDRIKVEGEAAWLAEYLDLKPGELDDWDEDEDEEPEHDDESGTTEQVAVDSGVS